VRSVPTLYIQIYASVYIYMCVCVCVCVCACARARACVCRSSAVTARVLSLEGSAEEWRGLCEMAVSLRVLSLQTAVTRVGT
jgi:hypothetical protein